MTHDDMKLVRKVLRAMELPSAERPLGVEYEPGIESPELERCLDRMLALGLVRRVPGTKSIGSSGTFYWAAYRPKPDLERWLEAARHDATWAAEVAELESLLVTQGPYSEIVLEAGNDRLVARAHRAQTGSFSGPPDADTMAAAKPCWLMVLNGDQVATIALDPSEVREETESRVHAWLTAYRTRVTGGLSRG